MKGKIYYPLLPLSIKSVFEGRLSDRNKLTLSESVEEHILLMILSNLESYRFSYLFGSNLKEAKNRHFRSDKEKNTLSTSIAKSLEQSIRMHEHRLKSSMNEFGNANPIVEVNVKADDSALPEIIISINGQIENIPFMNIKGKSFPIL